LGPYMNEAGFLLEEGNSIESVDKAMVAFGMPMGPLALLDEVGLDVAAKAGAVLSKAFGERMVPSKAIEKLLADGRLGKKNGKGVYAYAEGKRKDPDPSVYQVAGVGPAHPADAQAVVERMVLAMINEAALILDEKIVASAPELDLAMIMGTGFPPFRGGLLRYADSLSLTHVVTRLRELAAKVGPRFTPTAPLVRLAESGRHFYEAYP
ncbi:MAG: 3-hydroxyacyl-CoA dehydrogenase family protein, partial [Acidobacteriota bacterium]